MCRKATTEGVLSTMWALSWGPWATTGSREGGDTIMMSQKAQDPWCGLKPAVFVMVMVVKILGLRC